MPARPQGADYHHASQILLTPGAFRVLDNVAADQRSTVGVLNGVFVDGEQEGGGREYSRATMA